MIHFYRIATKVLNAGETLQVSSYEALSAIPPEKTSMKIDWYNLHTIAENNPLPFKVQETSSGRILCFDSGLKIKEWNKPIRIEIITEYAVIDNEKTIQDVLNYPDINLTIRFLKERGL